jgi:hypothetical protein
MYQNQVPEFSKKFPDLQGFGPTNVATGTVVEIRWVLSTQMGKKKRRKKKRK